MRAGETGLDRPSKGIWESRKGPWSWPHFTDVETWAQRGLALAVCPTIYTPVAPVPIGPVFKMRQLRLRDVKGLGSEVAEPEFLHTSPGFLQTCPVQNSSPELRTAREAGER